MNAAILPVIQCIAEDVMTLAHWVMDKQGLGDSRIREELYYVVEDSGNPLIQVFFNDYITYIESGRSANSGKMPPISALRDWALRKGIATDNKVLFAIAQSIQKHGIAPRPILVTLIEEMEKSFEKEWSVDMFDFIVEQLSEYFNE